jgi:hypothetical protein
MATDYFIETPYNKLQFFLVVFLAIVSTRKPHSTPAANGLLGAASRRALVALASVAALLSFAVTIQTEHKLIGAATSTALDRRAASHDPNAASRSALLTEATRVGETWASRPGHWKTLFRHHLALAQSHALVGNRIRARHHAIESVRLYPFNPQALRLVGALSDDPVEASRWQAAATHIEVSTSAGFHIAHPLREGMRSEVD